MSFRAISDIDQFTPRSQNGSVVTIGMFDGLHVGHRLIIDRVLEEAKKQNAEPVVITFDPHPKAILTPGDVPQLLTLPVEKELLLAGHDLTLLTLTFDQELRSLTAEAFVKKYLIDGLGMKSLTIGPSHAIGKRREGTPEKLMELGLQLGFTVQICEPVLFADEPVSSSRVRAAVQAGRFDDALAMLAGEYLISGPVERGIGLGKKLGIPTANLAILEGKLLPGEGVYACVANIDSDKKEGILFVGRNHFNPEPRLTVEVHLFDFDRDIYDQGMVVRPLKFIRENRKFSSTEALMEQVRQDIENAFTILKEKKNDRHQRAEGSHSR